MVKVTRVARPTLPDLKTQISLLSGLVILHTSRQASSEGVRRRLNGRIRYAWTSWDQSVTIAPRLRKGIRLTMPDWSRSVTQTHELDHLRVFGTQSYEYAGPLA